MLTLAEAIKSGRLPEFIAQEEARGVGPVDTEVFDAAVAATLKPERSVDRTSRSRSGGGSSGT